MSTPSKISLNAFSFLFSEIIQYTQNRVNDIQDLEKKLNTLGQHVGLRLLELLFKKNAKREYRIEDLLLFIYGPLWQYLFEKQMDTFERSTENIGEYMMSDNVPQFSKFVSIKTLNQFNPNAFVAGIMEGVLKGGLFPCRVSAHYISTTEFPLRTIFLVKLDKSILERETLLNKLK